jgi:murein endopeptidase
MVATAAILIGTLSSVSAAAGVNPEDYARTVCSYAASYATQASQLSPVVEQAVQSFQAQPSQANAVALRQALVDVLDQIAQAADQFAISTQSVGAPEVPRGARFAKAVVSHIRTNADGIRAMADLAYTIEVSSTTQFVTGLQLLVSTIEKTQARLIKRAARDPAFKRPATPLQPLVVFMTTDATTCPGVV